MSKKDFHGKLPPEGIRMLELPRLPAGVIDGFKALADLTATVSDVMDELGLVGVISAMELPPISLGNRIVGPALTVRNVPRRDQIHKAAIEGINTMAETDAHILAEPGDVLVIEGVTGCSNFGGQSAAMGLQQRESGAIIDGSIRDPDEERTTGFPVWCRGVTPITGKWRLQTVEINGPVHIAGIQVHPGDLVCADDAGICFVPHKRAVEVLDRSRIIDAASAKRGQDIANGVAVSEVVKRKYK